MLDLRISSDLTCESPCRFPLAFAGSDERYDADLTSVGFEKHPEALFIGQWVAPFLLIDIYNKMVKQHGSDAKSQTNSSPREGTGARVCGLGALFTHRDPR
jgi:hypothetical protein